MKLKKIILLALGLFFAMPMFLTADEQEVEIILTNCLLQR